MKLIITLLILATFGVSAVSMPADSRALTEKPLYVWDYQTASVCILKNLGAGANEIITAAVREKTMAAFQPTIDYCAKQPGLAGRPADSGLFLDVLVWTAYLDAGQCASSTVAVWTVADFDREIERLQANPADYKLPKVLEGAMMLCNPALSQWHAQEDQVSLQTLRSLRHARKWQDQLREWKADPKLRSQEGQLALCILERNPDGAYGAASAVTAGRNWAESIAVGRELLPEIAKPCASLFHPKLSIQEVMKPVADFLWVSRGSPRNWKN